MQCYHDSSEREPNDGDGDNSRSEEFKKLAGLSQARYLVTVKEALGYTHELTLDTSIALIESMLQEYAYICHERNKDMKNGNDEEKGSYEWVELPSWDDPTKTTRMKRFKDVGTESVILGKSKL